MQLTHLPTPCLLLDRAVLEANITAMQIRMAEHGIALRPHLKTAKSARIAECFDPKVARGITVSTLAEAAYFFEHGFNDILYAVGIAEFRLRRVAELIRRGANLSIITDNETAARAVAEAAIEANVTYNVLIEIDSGDGRAGVLPDGRELLEIAKLLHGSPGVELAGVMTHAGHSYNCQSIEEIEAVAEEERQAITEAANRLRDQNMPCPVVSAGSTPTAVHAQRLEGITEMRPGVFVFNDLKQLSIGSCTRKQLALSVLGSVIGHNRHRGHLILDTGALALSKDISAGDAMPSVGYGEVCDAETLEPIENLSVASVSQEHGIVPASDRIFDRLPIGSKIRILPNHACITAAAYDRYHVVEKDGTISEEWDRINGW